MLAQMDIVYAKAVQKFIEGGSMNLSNLKYILSEESYAKWQDSKSGLKSAFNKDLESILCKASIKKTFREALQVSYEKVVVDGKESYKFEKSFKKKMQSEAMPVISTVLKVELLNALNKAI